ncbi:MAG: glutathione peroxidase [Porphyromonas sp.]|nr:glutathione peroxidase [Porphyromonas sp.]
MRLRNIMLACGLLLMVGATSAQRPTEPTLARTNNKTKEMKQTIYDFSAKANNGQEVDFSQFAGKVLLIVNTASKCGLTPQYKALEELHDRYADQGLVVIGFPCDQFGNQEPGSDEEIKEFCQLNYGVSFRIMQKIEVNGDGAHPIYQYLKKASGGWFGDAIKWNFTKFLISRDGSKVERYAPITKPEAMVKDIEALLDEK